MTIRVVLADDHQIVCEGLAALLGRKPDLQVVGQVHSGPEAVSIVRELQPDVVVMDLTMPGLNGIEATRRIGQGAPSTKVLCLSVHVDKRLVCAMLDAGASGYVFKDCAFEELVIAIRTVAAGQVYLSPAVAGWVLEEYRAGRNAGQISGLYRLTDREREIVQLLAEGHSTKDIAARLHVSLKTVATHREHVMGKLQLRSIAELTKYAIREGLTALEAVSDVSGSASASGSRR